MTRRRERIGECVQCAECCKKMRITSVLSNVIAQHGSLEEARKYYSYHGVDISGVNEEGDRIFLELDLPCKQLTADNRCALFDKPDERPLICHKYPWFKDDVETCGFSFK